MIVCGKHHVKCVYDCIETSLSDCSTLYWKQQHIYPWYLKIDNSAVGQYFQMKFCAYFTEYFRIKHTQNLHRMHSDFTFLWYIVLGLLFSGHSVCILCIHHHHQQQQQQQHHYHWVLCAEIRFCESCKCIKPDRAHHCSSCHRQVPKLSVSHFRQILLWAHEYFVILTRYFVWCLFCTHNTMM